MAAIQLVLNNCDLVDHILSVSNFTFPEMNALEGVNRAFRVVAKPRYEALYTSQKRLFDKVYRAQMGRYHKALNLYDKYISGASLMSQISHFNLWPFLVHQPDMAENLFIMWSDMHTWCTVPFRPLLYDIVRFDIAKYVHFESVSHLTKRTMQRLVAFKGIKGAYRMSKSALVRHLKRPKNHSYVWN